MNAALLSALLVLAGPAPSAPGRVDCDVTSVRPEYRVGDAPELSVQIINRGPETIYLPGSLNGSERPMRYPHVQITAWGPKGRIPRGELMGCGNTNSLRPTDFVRLESGKSFDPYKRIDDGGFWPSSVLESFRFGGPGEYEFRFHYSTRSPSLQTWEGTPVCVNCPTPPEVLALLDRVPAVEIECSVRVRVAGNE